MPLEYEFSDRLKMSQGRSENSDIKNILLNNIPSALNVNSAHAKNDRNGTDYWVECESGKFLSVDCKVRSEDYVKKGYDDLALETWSVVENDIVGWTRDSKKQTDYVLWLWTDTGRWLLVPFQMLCGVFQKKWKDWKATYKSSRQHTPNYGGYHSECVFVPRKEVWSEIYRMYGGNCK
ncbi:MAG: hypothetical protein AB2793_09415 [Candidatus Thiodiazotropha sp.]